MTTLLPALSELHLLRPHWLWALAALPVLGWWWRRRRLRESPWRAAVDPHLLPHLLEPGAGRRGLGGLVVAALAYALAVFALAGPAWERVAQPAWHAPAPLVVALDLSSATTAADLPPSRLLHARAKLATLLAERAGGQVGLVAYADDAFTVAPLTQDAANVALFLDALEPSIMPVDGRRADRAIDWAARLLRQAGAGQGDILLVTGDAGDAAARAAAQAHADGYRVSVLGLGTPAGAAYRDRAGGIAHARLDAAALQAVASAGGGRLATVTRDTADLASLGVLDPQMAGAAPVGGEAPGRHWRDGGFWLLPLVMLLALPAFRRAGVVAAMALLVVLPMPPAHAADGGDLWRRPDQQAHARLLEGAEAYRAGEYARAAEAWRPLPGAHAQYNLGNALARDGRYREAIEAYDRALERAPGMADALANRDAVQAVLDAMPEGGEDEQGDEGDQGPDDGEPAAGQGGDPAQRGTRREGAPGEGDAEPGTPPEDPEPSAADTEAQRAADEAQRARMDEAMDRPDGAAPEETAMAQATNAAERERSIANQAWLQRVPDDPGGLLRRKFALEHERRQREGRP